MNAQRLAEVLGEVMTVEIEPDEALTVRYDGTFASVRLVTIAEGLDMISVTQMLAWDLPVNSQLRKRVAAQAQTTMLGTVTLVDQPAEDRKRADVVLRYNFPANALEDQPLRTLIMMVLAAGSDVRSALAN
jgi:hypothetical protein